MELMKIIIVAKPLLWYFSNLYTSLLLLLALVSDLIVDYDSFLHTQDGEITFYRNSLFDGIHFTFNRPSTVIKGAEVHIVPSPVTFAIPLLLGVIWVPVPVCLID